MAEQVIALAKKAGLSIAIAESITGGALASVLIGVDGASEVILGGIVAYQDRIKEQLLGVSPALIANQSAVDAEVAAQMAEGVRERLSKAAGKDASLVIGVATTGVAGPRSVSGRKPGEVYIAISSSLGVTVYSESFEGSRNQIRMLTQDRAIEILREHLA
ncbi:CinA family protein [Aquiluna sp. Uisw_065]|jgi:nicotinamide-nucleotide amidase|uniref:CinA family protein n=1 Tax=Aquiluna sp. Uisw_065 TaxID=3230967 RepID=UPI0039E94F25